MSNYIVRTARASTHDDCPRLSDVLANCPDGYRLHSVVPIAQGGGYTGYQQVIFEKIDHGRRVRSEQEKSE